MNKDKREIEIDLMGIIRALWGSVHYIILVMLVLAIIGSVYSATLVTPIYEATAKMIVNTRYDADKDVTNDQLNSAKNLVDVYAIIIRSRDVLGRVKDELELKESYSALLNSVKVSSVNDTPVMQVVVHHKDRETALRIAAKILEITPAIIVETVEAGSVKPVENAYAGTAPVSPNIVRNGILMALLGFIVSCAVVIILFLSDNTYKTDIDIQKDVELPVLGVIPTIESCKGPARYGHTQKGATK